MTARAPTERDQDATPFSEILSELCEVSGSRSAALVDREGETVDYAGRGDPFDIRILAAEWQLILQRIGETAILAQSFQVVVRAKKRSYLLEVLPEGYALVVELGRRSTGLSDRALSQARARLCDEAGFPQREDPHGNWSRVEVEEERGDVRRPTRMSVEQQAWDVTVIGRVTEDAVVAREESYRVRLSSGEERTLVREPLGHWYLEEDPWSPPSRVR